MRLYLCAISTGSDARFEVRSQRESALCARATAVSTMVKSMGKEGGCPRFEILIGAAPQAAVFVVDGLRKSVRVSDSCNSKR